MKFSARELERLRSSKEVADEMQEFFDESSNACDLPLDGFCEMGGSSDPEDTPEIQVLDAQLDANYCTGTLTAYFNEVVYGGGCPDMPTVKPRLGDVAFKVRLHDGTVTFD